MIVELTEVEKQRFFAKTKQVESGCIEWVGGTNNRGVGGVEYGLFKIPKTRKNITAHRLAYMLAHGEIPEGMLVCHSCDNPSCVNPSHLFLGTARDNVADMDKKGRRVNPPRAGTSNGRASLTEIQIREIRTSGKRQAQLAREYGVTKSQIHRIVHNQQWETITK